MIGQGLNRVAMAERLSIPQLEEAIQNKTIPAYIGIPLLEEKTQFEERMRAAQMGMNQPPQMTIADQVMQQANMVEGGIDQIPVEMEMAGGGIVAFENGGDVKELMAQMTPDELALYQQTGQLPVRMQSLAPTQDMGIAPPMPKDQDAISLTGQPDQGLGATAPAKQMFPPLDPNEILAQTEALYGGLYGKGAGAAAPGDKMSYVGRAEEFFKKAGVDLDLAAKQAADIAAEKEALGKDREEAKKMRIIEAGFAILGGTSPNAFENIGKGATQALKGYASDIKDLQKTERELGDASRKMMQAQNQIRMGVATAAGEDYQKAVERYNAANKDMADRKAGLAEKLLTNRNSQMIVQAQMRSNLGETTDIIFKEMVSKGANPNDPKTMADARREAVKLTDMTRLSGQEATDRRKAADLVADKLKNFASIESREYRRILAAQGPAAAEAYKEELINSELRALGRVPSGERGEAPPLPPGFQLQPTR